MCKTVINAGISMFIIINPVLAGGLAPRRTRITKQKDISHNTSLDLCNIYTV